jgi:hypothetical protein
MPDEPKVGLSISGPDEKRLSDFLLQFSGLFGEQAPSAETRPTATTSCIQTDPSATITNKPYVDIILVRIWRFKHRLIMCLSRKLSCLVHLLTIHQY